MKTVLHVIPTLEGGGAERQLVMLAAEQRRRGWSVHIGLRRGGVHESRATAAGVRLHRLGDFRGVHPLLIRNLVGVVRSTRPDIIQSWLPQMDVIVGIATRLVAAYWVLSERTSGDAYRAGRPLVRLRAMLGLRANAIVANSTGGAAYWTKFARQPAVAVVPNAVDLEAVQQASRNDFTMLREKGPLLFVGRLIGSKAPTLFVEALSLVSRQREISGIILGEGPLRASLERRIQVLRLGSRVEVRGYQENWWPLLGSASGLVSTSTLEGQPNAVLEAMAAGCPVVVSDIKPHRAILDERSALFAQPNDPIATARAIHLLLEKSAETIERARCAYKRVALHSMERVAAEYERVYGGAL